MGLSNAERQARWCTKWDAEIERLRKVAAEQSEQLAEAQREIEIVALARENAALKVALAHERKQHAAGIASLMKANRELRAKLRHMHQFYEDESSRKGIMAFSTYGKLMKCLHPDSKPSDAERSEACCLLGQWKQSADRARHHA